MAVLLTGATYLTGAVLLVYRYNSINGDALARVNNGALMVFSRDPHMAAVGFVWNPLPSFLSTPLLFLKPWWPSLLTRGFAGSIIAAVCMAAAVGVLLAMLREWGIGALARWGLLIGFAAHPLVLYAGSNGMSEAPYLLLLLVGCRYLARWLKTDSTADLVACGVALAVGYYTRYEVIVAGAGVVGLVAMVRIGRTTGDWRNRAREALVDVGIVASPFVFAFISWAAVSWVIVGSPFEQFTSEYGNTAQLAAMGKNLDVPRSGGPALRFATRQLLLINLAIPVGIVLPLVIALRRRAVAVLAPWATFGSILAFELLAYSRGQTASWLRYYIIAVPLIILAMATMAIPTVSRSGTRQMPGRLMLNGIALLVTGAGLVSAASMISDHRLAREESTQLQGVFDHRSATPGSRLALDRFGTEQEVVRYLDDLEPGRGSVLIDLFQGFKITTQAPDMAMFVLTSDRDFQEAVADPVTFRIKYIVVPDLVRGGLDAINTAYPSLYQDGAGIAGLVKEFENVSDFPNWRLYKVNEAAP